MCNLLVRDEYIRKNLESIHNEYAFLCLKSEIYLTFKNKASILIEASPSTFAILSESIKDDIILSLSRLNDPKESQRGINKNSTIDRINSDFQELLKNPEYKEDETNIDINKKVKNFNESINALKELIKSIKHFRDKRLAHRDLDTVISEYENNKNKITPDDSDIMRCIKLIGEIIKIFYSVIYKICMDEKIMFPLQDIEYFVRNLDEGNKWRKKFNAEMKSKYLPKNIE